MTSSLNSFAPLAGTGNLNQALPDLNSPTGEASSVDSNYTSPAPNTPGGAVYTQAQMQAALAQNQQNQQYGISNPTTGMSPSTIGSLAGKAVNMATGNSANGSGTFSQVTNAINNWGAENLGTAGSTTVTGDANSAIASLGNLANEAGTTANELETQNAISSLGTIPGIAPTNVGGGLFDALDGSGNVIGSGAVGTGPGVFSAGTDAFGNAIPAAGADATTGSLGLTGASDVASSGSSLGISGSLTGILGGAGIGAGEGALLSNLTGGNQTNSTIGGGLGGAVGAAFGGAALSAIGLELGSFAGPLGAVVGGALGGLVGGLFGPSGTPTQSDSASGQLAANGTTTVQAGGSKNAGNLSNFSTNGVSQFSQMTAGASSALGINFNPNLNVGVNISTQHGGAYIGATNSQTGQSIDIPFNYQSQASAQAAELQVLQFAAAQSGYTNTTALNNWYNNATSTAGNYTPPTQPTVTPSTGTSGSFASYVAANPNPTNNTNTPLAPNVSLSPTV